MNNKDVLPMKYSLIPRPFLPEKLWGPGDEDMQYHINKVAFNWDNPSYNI